jgi:hypothetical protein
MVTYSFEDFIDANRAQYDANVRAELATGKTQLDATRAVRAQWQREYTQAQFERAYDI